MDPETKSTQDELEQLTEQAAAEAGIDDILRAYEPYERSYMAATAAMAPIATYTSSTTSA